METAILAVVDMVLLIACGIFLYENRRQRRISAIADAQRFVLESSLKRIREDWEKEKNAAFERGRESMRTALTLKAKEQSAFDKPDDKIPAGKQRYTPIARARAAAEAASLGPSNHRDKVTANNAKVMETL